MRLALAGLLWSAMPALAAESWIQLPEPELSELEPAVAAQLQRLSESTQEQLSDDSASLEVLAEAVGDLGRHYHAYGLVEAADQCYRVARRLDPEDFQWPYFRGYLLQSAGRLGDAEAAYLEALGLFRRVPPALLRLGEVYRELGRPEEAEVLFREALALEPTSAASLAALGELYASEGRHEEAIRLLEMALAQVPEATRLYYPLAMAYRSAGDLDKAKDLLARQGPVGVKPADPLIDGLTDLRTGERVFLLQGQAAFRAGRFAEAVEAFRQAVSVAPQSVSARIGLGSALGELGETEAALIEYSTALEIAPSNPTALFNAGLLQAQNGDLESAVANLQTATQYAPEDVTLRIHLANALRRSGNLESALAEYRVAVELDPSEEDARLGEAQALASMGRYADARDALERGLAQVPTSGLMAHALSRMLAMGPEPSIRDGARALDLAEKVFAAQPRPEYAEVVAAALAALGRCEEAAKWQLEVLERTSGDELLEQRRKVLALYSQGPPCSYPAN